jgi:hypothetical protein
MRVKFLESVRFEGKDYERGKKYNLPDKSAYALGDSVERLGGSKAGSKTAQKQVAKPKADKMVKTAPKTK